MKQKLRLIILLVSSLALLVGVFGFGFVQWQAYVWEKQVRENFDRAQSHMEAGASAEALKELILTRPAAFPDDLERAWIELEISATTAVRDMAHLDLLAQHYFDWIKANEEASLLLARQYIIARRIGDFEDLYMRWGDVSSTPLRWIVLKVDSQIAAGKAAEAVETIESVVSAEAIQGQERALSSLWERLALLQIEDLEAARTSLINALELNVENPDVQTFLANIDEAVGDPDAARLGYIAAHLLAPENPRFIDNLAEFYRREGLIAQAIETWNGAPVGEDYAVFSVKAWFWDKMVFGRLPVYSASAEGSATPLHTAWGTYTESVDPHHFWNFATEDALFAAWPSLERRQEVHWLRLLEYLKMDQREAALDLFSYAREDMGTRAPELSRVLQYLLHLRTADPTAYRESIAFSNELREGNPFWAWLQEESRVQGDAETPIASAVGADWNFSAACLARGWLNAGVNLVSIESADEASSFADTPDWYAFGLSKAYQILGQPENAIRVIDSLVELSPSLNSLRAELYWQTGKEDEAVAIWHELVQIPETEIRAAWLLGTYYFDQGNDAGLEQVLKASPALRESWLGALFRARQALRSGDVATARTIYQGVVDQSDEALLFLLKDSFARREFEEARGYNDALREKYPNEPEFLVNEQKIVAALE